MPALFDSYINSNLESTYKLYSIACTYTRVLVSFSINAILREVDIDVTDNNGYLINTVRKKQFRIKDVDFKGAGLDIPRKGDTITVLDTAEVFIVDSPPIFKRHQFMCTVIKSTV